MVASVQTIDSMHSASVLAFCYSQPVLVRSKVVKAIKFGVDNDGHFIQFQFGFTGINFVQTNSPDTFELCLSVDAFGFSTLFLFVDCSKQKRERER
jgi:hypothetical protein